MLLKRHRNVTIKGLPFRVTKKYIFKGHHPSLAHAEKITQRNRYSRFTGIIPVHFDINRPQSDRVAVDYGHPNSINDASSVKVQ